MTLALTGIGGAEILEGESEKISLSVEGQFGAYVLKNVNTVKGLTLPDQTLELGSLEYEHLKGVKIEPYKQATPKVLIGQDNWDLIVAREIREAGKDAPAASRTRLGWAMHGAKRGDGGQRTQRVCDVTHTSRHGSEPNGMGDEIDASYPRVSEVILPYRLIRRHAVRQNKRGRAASVKNLGNRYEAGGRYLANGVALEERRK
jgi:hypothetical protein